MLNRTKSLAISALAALVCALAPASAPAQRTRTRSERRDQLWLARSCAHELTWETDRDCEPMYEALQGTLDAWGRVSPSGRRRTLADAIRLYQRHLWNGTSQRPWARALRPGVLVDPPGWPRTWPAYSNFASDFARVYEQAGAIVRGEAPRLCAERPRHWGSRDPALPDLARARRAIAEGRWREVDCGPTRQAYYAVVRRAQLL